MSEEVWKDIEGYNGKYQVSNLGRIKSLKFRGVLNRISILKPDISNCGYARITLFDTSGKRHKMEVHRLVAEAFIDNPNRLPCVNHKDENKLNNFVENLEWCDYKYNSNYGAIKERSVKNRDNSRCGHHKAVDQFSLEGEFLNSFQSASEASAIILGDKKYSSNISACCRGVLKQSHGFIWRYKDEEV